MSEDSPLAAPLVRWQRTHGRHDLPWQAKRTSYRVWVSEIMLQQTQVATVIDYYQRFMQRFPDVGALAAAPIDEVLHLWAGLGYYSRARNLHRTAQRVVAQFGGEFPRDAAALASLPGIGRSTAGAILALGSNLRAPILDGNVRRVLARYFAVGGDPASSAVTRQLWALAERCTPMDDVGTYTQAIMDLGATVCTRHNPACERCPLREGCTAKREERQHELPQRRVRAARTTRRVAMLLLVNAQGQVLLQRRGEQGVWAGLWTPPQFESVDAARAYREQCVPHDGAEQMLPVLRHIFTHFDLEITPLVYRCVSSAEAGSALRGDLPRPRNVADHMNTPGALAVAEPCAQPDQIWYDPSAPARVGLPAPVSTLLKLAVPGEFRLENVADDKRRPRARAARRD